MASPKGDLPKRGFVQQNLTSTLQPNKPNRGVLLMDVFIITCIFLKSNQKRQKNYVFFFCLLKEGNERRNKKRPRTAQGTDALLFFFLFFPLSFFLHFPFLRGHRCPSFFSSSFRLSRQPVISVPFLSFSIFMKKKGKKRPISMSFLSRFFSASFQGQKKDSQHSASSA